MTPPEHATSSNSQPLSDPERESVSSRRYTFVPRHRTAPAYRRCNDCGLKVANEEVHDKWHDRIDMIERLASRAESRGARIG